MIANIMRVGLSFYRPRIAVPTGCALLAGGYYLGNGFVTGLGVGHLLIVLLAAVFPGANR